MTTIHDPINDDTWMDHALCQDVDPGVFFPERGQPTAPAKRICAACPVRAECLSYAVDRYMTHGIWGGTSERERRQIRADRRRAAA